MQRVFSLILFLVTIPFFIIVSFMILIFDGYPIFFTQNRLGIKKNPFSIYKFRTMKTGEITAIGKILRRTGFDELPQLINIIKGEMNFVGPRPLTQADIDRLDWNGNNYEQRWSVKPGLTGLSQLSNVCSAQNTIENDFQYVNSRSILFDLKIIFQSFLVPLIGKEKAKKIIQKA